MDRKKQLREQYKQMRPEMGVFLVRLQSGPQGYLEAVKDLKGVINSTVFKLKAGGHRHKKLQEAWNRHGAEAFVIEILETLDYRSDDPQADYSEDLAIMKLTWEERLKREGMELF